MFVPVLLLALPSLVTALFGMPDWDRLQVTWDSECGSARGFSSMPLRECDAEKQGWSMISDCGENYHFAGKRYAKDDDMAVVLLYDRNGFIAGIQSGFPDDKTKGYPSKQLVNSPLIHSDDHHFITAYFTDPENICEEGRSLTKFKAEGVGKSLYIQNGTRPSSSIRLPESETEAENTLWMKGHCFRTMGIHYWYNLRTDMDCGEFYPMFLMFNDGKLNAFGWAFMGNYTSTRFEHPVGNIFGSFLDPVPQCLYNQTQGFTTMHIYMSDPTFCLC